ncbi:hypothetical protein R3P38DRAFT_2779035 [Favolaschia claudopus]|uniref:Uncharacterized protein n=1 Tax=Favolaschia claudopus TaxID=2862362 RepID=A0AAV9ZLG8_9AGAR
MLPRIVSRAKKLLTGQQLVQPSQAVPHLMAEVEDFSVELVSRKGYEGKVDGCFFATDVHLPILVPTPFNVGTDFAHATIYDLYVNAFVAYAGLPHAVDMSRGMRTVEGYRGLVLDNPYTIFFTPQNVDEPLNMSVATDKGRTVWRGNILVVKHEADTDKPLNITEDEAARITLIVRKQLDHGCFRLCPSTVQQEPDVVPFGWVKHMHVPTWGFPRCRPSAVSSYPLAGFDGSISSLFVVVPALYSAAPKCGVWAEF